MGQGTFVTTNRPVQRAAKALRLSIDVPLLLIVVTLLVFGLLMVLSASVDPSLQIGGSPTYLFVRQIRWVVLGVVIAIVVSFIPYHRLKRLMVPGLAFTLLALLAVLIVSDTRFNATRTLTGGSIQPSELAKVMTILYLSFWLYGKREVLGEVQFGLVPLGAILGGVGGLVVLQPDLSATLTIVALGGILFFLAGAEWRQIILLLVVAVVFAAIMVTVVSTGSSRITSYIDGLNNPTEASYHVRRSLEAVVNGGFFGVGIGKGTTKFIGLPVPATDSIFAVIAEETGILGSALVVLLYVGLLWRGLTIAKRAKDQLGALMAAGLTIWLVMEAMINMTVIVGLLPVSGNALPFISVGGSSMVASLTAIGLITAVARTSAHEESEEGKTFSAVVDLRRRDRGGRVPRSYRSASPRE